MKKLEVKEKIDSAVVWAELAKEGLVELFAEINNNPVLSNFAPSALSKLEQGVAGTQGWLEDVQGDLTISEAQKALGIEEVQQSA